MHQSESPVPVFISQAVTLARRFYLPLDTESDRKFTVHCGGWERCAPDYEIDRRRFPYYGIEFVAGGKGSLELDGKSYPLRPGMAFVYGREMPHRIQNDPEDCLIKYFLDVSGSPCESLLREAGLEPGTCRWVSELNRVTDVFEQLIVAGRGAGPYAARITALQAQVLLLHMAESRSAKEAQMPSWRTFTRCRAYLDKHFLELSSAQAAARACHIDPAYLSRLFTLHACEPPYRYLMRKRMAYAAELLHEEKLIVREVAQRLGMDAFQFSKSFKRIYGYSPASFIARHRGE